MGPSCLNAQNKAGRRLATSSLVAQCAAWMSGRHSTRRSVGLPVIFLSLLTIASATGLPAVDRSERIVSPERTLRRFAIALVAGNERDLRATAVPHDDLDVLLSDKRPSGTALQMIRTQIERSRIKTHQANEEIKLPNGQTFTVTPDLVGDDRKVMSLVAMPIPMCLRRIDGQWRVDAYPLIAARRASATSQE